MQPEAGGNSTTACARPPGGERAAGPAARGDGARGARGGAGRSRLDEGDEAGVGVVDQHVEEDGARPEVDPPVVLQEREPLQRARAVGRQRDVEARARVRDPRPPNIRPLAQLGRGPPAPHALPEPV